MTASDDCATLLRRGSRTFFLASRLLPIHVRQPAEALYGFCRLADDAIDIGDPEDAQLRLTDLEHRLDLAYAGTPRNIPADRAFAVLVAEYAIPRALPQGLLEGFAWDAEKRRYEDLDALHAYGVRVAGTVGAMMAMIMGVRDPAMVARASDLGVAMQLTNIVRDIGEDARANRIYLPLQWLHAAGIDPDTWIRQPCFDERLTQPIARLLHAADALYDSARAGISALPFGLRSGIRAAALLYREIGVEVARRDFDSVNSRAVVPTRRQLVLLARSVAAPHWAPAIDSSVMPAAQFLVDAVGAAPNPSARPGGIEWVVELFARLEERERAMVHERPRRGQIASA